MSDNSTPDDNPIDDWLDELERAHESGRRLLPEDLCDDPKLLEELRSQWEDLVEMNAIMVVPETTQSIPNGSQDQSTSDQPHLRTIGPYKLLQEIGEGGMGVVWMAEQTEPIKRRVALKLIRGHFAGKKVIARFEAERQALAMMDHPNIARVLDAGQTDMGIPYFVMELVEGIPITKYCDQKRFTVKERLELFVQVCDGIQHAHTKGIIHRDIKPGNVLVTQYDGVPVAKVIDFGIAKAMDTDLTDKTLFTEFGQVMGTYLYMSPEQAEMNALAIDTRTDVFALGVLLYELLTGETPITRKTLETQSLLAVLELIRNLETPKPSERISSSKQKKVADSRSAKVDSLVSTVRGDLDAVLTKATANERGRRYVTPSHFANDVKRFLNGEPVEARVPSFAYRARKFVGRHKKTVAVVSITLLLLVIGIVGTTSGMLWALMEKEKNGRLADKNGELANREKEARVREQELRIKREHELYISDFLRASTLYEDGDLLSAQMMLGNLSDHAETPEMRLLIRNVIGTPLTLLGHSGPIKGIAVSADDRQLVSASEDGEIVVWNLESGQIVRRLKVPTGKINTVAFASDEKKIIAGGAANNANGIGYVATLYVWNIDAADESPEFSIESGLTQVWSICPIASTSMFLVGGSGGYFGAKTNNLEQYSTTDGTRIRSLRAIDGDIASVQVAKDLESVFCMGRGGWDIAAWELDKLQIGEQVFDSKRQCSAFAVHPNGMSYCVGSEGGNLSLCKVAGNELAWTSGSSSKVETLSVSPNGKYVASGHQDGIVRLWHFDDGSMLSQMKGHVAAVSTVQFSHDGRRIFSGSVDGTIKEWSLAHHPHTRQIEHPGLMVKQLDFSKRDNSLFAHGSGSSTLIQWDNLSGRIINTWGVPTGSRVGLFGITSAAQFENQTIAETNRGEITIWNLQSDPVEIAIGEHAGADEIIWSSDGNLLASINTRSGLRVWNPRNASLIWEFDFNSNPNLGKIQLKPNAVRIDDNNRYLFAGTMSSEILVWDLEKQTFEARLAPPGSGTPASGASLNSIDFHAESGGLVSAATGTTLAYRWDTDKRTVTGPLLQTNLDTRINNVKFTSDGSRILGGWGPALFDGTTGRELTTIYTGGASKIATSGTGRWFAFQSGGNDPIYLTDLATCQRLQTLKGHDGLVTSLAISTDGKWLATASLDSTVILWHLQSGEKIHHWPHKRPVYELAFTDDEQTVVAKDSFGEIYAWNVKSGSSVLQTSEETTASNVFHAVKLHKDRKFSSSADGKCFARAWANLIVVTRQSNEIDPWRENQERLENKREGNSR